MAFVSPQEMYDASCAEMLDGLDPVTEEDWAKLVNFWAFNIDAEVAYEAVKLICMIFDVPLEDEVIREIVDHQVAARRYG